MAVLSLGGHAGARVGRVFRRELAHARPRCGLAAPWRAPGAPNAALLSYLGLRERQRVGLVRGVSHHGAYILFTPPPLLSQSSVPICVIYAIFPFSTWEFLFRPRSI